MIEELRPQKKKRVNDKTEYSQNSGQASLKRTEGEDCEEKRREEN